MNSEYKFTNYSAVAIAEGFQEASCEEEFFAAWQYLIDIGLVWQLQGFFGRTAKYLIDIGKCSPANV